MNCDNCDKVTEEANEMEDGSYVCDSCYQDAIGRMEYAYEAYREAEVTGN